LVDPERAQEEKPMYRELPMVAAFVALAPLVVEGESKKDTRPRVFVVESDSWSMGDELNVLDWADIGSVVGGAKPQTAEIVKTLHERCPLVVVTRKEDRADYVLVLEHEGGKDVVRKDNKFALFNADGDALASGSTRLLGNAVKEACQAIGSDWRQADSER
jgi:hypothetical protein